MAQYNFWAFPLRTALLHDGVEDLIVVSWSNLKAAQD